MHDQGTSLSCIKTDGRGNISYFQLTKVHEDQSLVKMNECITLLEGEIEAGKKAFEEVLHAEIIARQTQNEKTLDKCNELQEKLAIAVATLQQAISGVTSQTQEAIDQVIYELCIYKDCSVPPRDPVRIISY